MRIYIGVLITTVFLIFLTTGCAKDEILPDAPTITNTEFGHDNNKTAYVGADLHVAAQISAPGKIDNIKIELHPESDGGWEYNEAFKEDFEGLLNATFHKHLQISEEAIPGEYHLHFIVTDKNGRQTSVEAPIDILQVSDSAEV